MEEDAASARPQHSRNLLRAKNEHTTIEELLGAVFSVVSMFRLYNELDSNNNLDRAAEGANWPTDHQMSLDFRLSEVHRLLQIKRFRWFLYAVNCYSCSD